jgi:hypothetical protein
VIDTKDVIFAVGVVLVFGSPILMGLLLIQRTLLGKEDYTTMEALPPLQMSYDSRVILITE